jgi:4,5-dihydroxyphthalate decarboxylase
MFKENMTSRRCLWGTGLLHLKGEAKFVAIPVFPSRMFRHGFIFCRKASGINSPAELSGKKIGFPRWVQTAAIWIRGTLADEYGVSAKDTQWYVISMHHWDDADPGAAVMPRDGSAIQWLQTNRRTRAACRALFDERGRCPGRDGGSARFCWQTMSQKIVRKPREVEAKYFRRQNPADHACHGAKKDLAERHPELPGTVSPFSESSVGRRWRRDSQPG